MSAVWSGVQLRTISSAADCVLLRLREWEEPSVTGGQLQGLNQKKVEVGRAVTLP